ncbi:MAG: hypothetical protein N7Q72_03415, partial [Spiroplasma sp. Tabriz.8]|nr:hypothetical protein [Spiroplasma sp. Tabriz.8]
MRVFALRSLKRLCIKVFAIHIFFLITMNIYIYIYIYIFLRVKNKTIWTCELYKGGYFSHKLQTPLPFLWAAKTGS